MADLFDWSTLVTIATGPMGVLVAVVWAICIIIYLVKKFGENRNKPKIRDWNMRDETSWSTRNEIDVGGINMSKAEERYNCDECNTQYKTKQEAKDCCNARISKSFNCSECNESYDTAEEAAACCLSESGNTTKENTDNDLKKTTIKKLTELGIKVFELDGPVDNRDYEQPLFPKFVSGFDIFIRLYQKLGSLTEEVYLYETDDGLEAVFTSKNEKWYGVCITDESELTIKPGL